MNLYAYKMGSRSSKIVAESLGIKRIKHKNSKFRGRINKTVINWGANNLPDEVKKCTVLNNPASVNACADKKMFFECMDDAGYSENLVPYTTNKEEALEWLQEGSTVVCRTLTKANSGRGIIIAEEAAELVDAPLYTKYVPKKYEYRIHLYKNKEGNSKVFDTQRKARNRDVADDDVNWKIRNYDNGFIFARNEEHNIPPIVMINAAEVFSATGLDFAAVDIIYNERQDKAYILEINTAPGIEGTTLDNYVKMFKEFM